MRRFLSAVLVSVAIVAACERTPVGPETGGITFQVFTIGITPSRSGAAAVAAGQAAQAGQAALDSARVILTGPISRTVSATPGSDVVITNLSEGSYTAVLEGWEGGELTYMGTVTDIQVVNGQETTATSLFAPVRIGFTAIDETLQLNSPPGTVPSWSSANPDIANVDLAGLVTAASNGQGTITGTLGSSTVVILVHVEQTVESVTVAPLTATINAGETQQFTATAFDVGGSPVLDVNILWVSSNHNVATVDQSGLATGVAGGSATISAAGRGEPGSAALDVTALPAGAAQVAFTTHPTDAQAGTAIAPGVTVAIQDAFGNTVTSATDAVTVAIWTNPGEGTLSGTMTVSAVAGVASFTDLSIDKAASGYRLTAISDAPPSSSATATSEAFAITAGPASEITATMAASVPSIIADGVVKSTITVQLKDGFGNNLTAGGDAVTLVPFVGSMTAVADNGDGTYSAALTGTAAGTASITGTVNGVTMAESESVEITLIRLAEMQVGIAAALSDMFINADLGPLTGTYTVLTEAVFNSMTPAELRASFDVLAIGWPGSTIANADFNTRLLPYMELGGGIIWEDPSNAGDLAPAVIVDGTTPVSFPNVITVAVPGLTDGIIGGDLTTSHFTIESFEPPFTAFLGGTAGETQGVFGQFGAGCIIVTGPDDFWHASRLGVGTAYTFVLNKVNFAARGCPSP